MKRIGSLTAVLTILVALTVALSLTTLGPARPALAEATTVTTNARIPVSGWTYTNVCTGEIVQVSGYANVLAHLTIHDSGRSSVIAHFNFAGLGGTSLTDGAQYRLLSVDQSVFNTTDPLPAEFTIVSHFRLVGQGPDNDLTIRFIGHVTVNANGEVTGIVLNGTEGTCQ